MTGATAEASAVPAPDARPPAKRAGVVGASGILGGELLRILALHPGLELEYISAQSRAGRAATELNPHLKDAGIGEFEAFDARTAAKRCDVVFVATPPETAGQTVPELLDAGAEIVIDLSPAYRVRDPELHRQWYPDVERDRAVAESAVYGLPELNREALADASVIAMPGCFATAILLAALPLRELEDVGYDAITIDGKSGSTGSGARLRESGAHTWRANVVAPYAPRGHRHVAEVQQAMEDHGVGADGRPPRLGMTTYGVDLVRGLSVGLYSFFEGELDERALRRAYHRTYRDERFVRVQVGRGSALPLPDPKAVIGSNYCDVAPFVDESADRFVLIAAIDNMVKGGAGQAVQACNARLGFPEQQGLEALPVFPV
jgi:N-acetyl-gamma-glutamyl-phosphate/LysW-gamma-L-alpha-aminoadipyl-6-phosphate reductase